MAKLLCELNSLLDKDLHKIWSAGNEAECGNT